jgi:hypothetical protein
MRRPDRFGNLEIWKFGNLEIGNRQHKESAMKNKKTNNPKKNGTLRPWLVDVVIDNLR